METKDKDLSEALPAYVNGTLDDAIRLKVEAFLRTSPQAQAEVAWLRKIREQIQAAENKRNLPAADAGLDRLMALINAEQAGKVVHLPRASRPLAPWYKPAFAIAACAVIVQAVVLQVMLRDGSGTDAIRSLSGTIASQPGDILQITFKSEATEPQIRSSLASIGGEIVSGPGALGIYSVRVGKGQGQNAVIQLVPQKNVIDSVTLLKN